MLARPGPILTRPARPTRRLGLVTLVVLLAVSCASCASTRLRVTQSSQDINAFFVIVGEAEHLEEVLNDRSVASLGGLTVNLSTSNTYAYAEFQLQQDAARTWRVAQAPEVDWLKHRITDDPSEVRLTIEKSALRRWDDLAVMIVTRAPDESGNLTYFGSLLRPEELALRSSMLIFSKGPIIDVVLQDDKAPSLDVD